MFVVGFQESNSVGELVYGVAEITGWCMDAPTWNIQWMLVEGQESVDARLQGFALGVPIWKVCINAGFDGWRVERAQ